MSIDSKVTHPIKKLAKLALLIGGIYVGATVAPILFSSSTASYYGAASGGALTGYAVSKMK